MRLTFVAAVLLIASIAQGQLKTKVYTNAECGLRFEVPAGWVIKPSTTPNFPSATCSLDVQPVAIAKRKKNDDDITANWLTVAIMNAGLEDAADQAGFEKSGQKWVAMGRQGIEDPTNRVSGEGWTGITGTATVGCFGSEGYAGLCDNPRAVLTDRGHRSAIIDGGPQDEEAFNRVLKTFRFITQQITYKSEDRWEEVCRKVQAEPLQPPVLTGPLLTVELQKCDETAFYYGLGQDPNYPAALQCGWYERAHPQNTTANMFYGPGVLSMLYANGFGVKRDYGLAIRFACEIDWASPAEHAGRIGHLEHLRDTKSIASNFDLCDDITSGLSQGQCAEIDARKGDAKRADKLQRIESSLPPGAQSIFSELQRAEAAFEDARISNEIDMTGTARNMFAITDRTRLRDQFLINLDRFGRSDVPQASKEDLAKLDQQLNDVYRQIQEAPADAWQNTTVTPAGIRDTERAWLQLADAWMKFAAAAYPKLSPERVRAQLIRLRLHQLQRLAPRD